MILSALIRTTLVTLALLVLGHSGFIQALTVKFDNEWDYELPTASAGLVERTRQPSELAIIKRMSRGTSVLGPGWVGHFIPSTVIYPYPIGLLILGKFYSITIISAAGRWKTKLLSNTRLIRYGTITLLFWSPDPLVRITWEFVRGFAEMMLAETKAGFMALYDASFVHVVTGMTVHVKFQIAGKG
ncbi:MAG: hypothetical protein Q9218_000480 [Villophora microphyllina]